MYKLTVAAHYLGVEPWELADQPSAWTEWAFMADGVDQEMAARRMAALFGGDGKGKTKGRGRAP